MLYWYRLLFVYFDAGFKPCKTCRTNKTEGGFRLFSVAHHHFTVEPCSGKWRPTTKGEGNGHFGSLYISGKLPCYPSPRPTFTLTFHLEKNVGLGEGLVEPSGGGGGAGIKTSGMIEWGRVNVKRNPFSLSCPVSFVFHSLFIVNFFSSCLLKKALEADTAHCAVCIVTNNCTANISSIGWYILFHCSVIRSLPLSLSTTWSRRVKPVTTHINKRIVQQYVERARHPKNLNIICKLLSWEILAFTSKMATWASGCGYSFFPTYT